MSRRTLGRKNRGLSGVSRAVAELLECRRLLATVTVNNTTDMVNGNTTSIATLLANNGGDGISLREALFAANNTANSGGPDVINFQIPGVGTHIISLLPLFGPMTLTDPVTIDATTESDYAGAPSVEINGGDFGTEGFIIETSASGSTLRGMAINRSSIGVLIRGSNNVVEACYLGVDATGTLSRPNSDSGVSVSPLSGDAIGNRIGGTTAAQRNVISSNGFGVRLNALPVATIQFTLVQGNYIGTNAAGTADMGNTNHGVSLSGPAAANTIGGDTAGAGNVISGNNSNGVYLSGSGAGGNWIGGNLIGTNAAGTAALANGTGVLLDGAYVNTVGGPIGARNVISGNTQDGVRIAGGVGNFVENNYIGTNAAGTAALANGDCGVEVNGTLNRIGTPGAGNVISGNLSAGVLLNGADNTARGNIIGLNAAGTAAIPNQIGLWAINGASTIGGTADGAGNVISGNTASGIILDPSAPGCTVQGNFVGTNAAGTAAVGNNGNSGISVFSGNHLIGGSVVGARNVISGNPGHGIEIFAASGVTISGNYIGTNAAGTAPLGNFNGIFLNGATNITIGGTTAGERNVIASSVNAGVQVAAGSTGAQIRGNYIGTNAAGDAALGNGTGILSFADATTIGGTAAGSGNVISGNSGNGLFVSGAAADTVVQGNLIGTNSAGTAAVGNGEQGILLNGGTRALIGGTAAGARNVVSGNKGFAGIYNAGNASLTRIESNYVGTDVTGTIALGNLHGVLVDNDDGVTIGGTTAASRNVISGNVQSGIFLFSNAEAVTIYGNLIGTRSDGVSPLGNASHGIFVGNTVLSVNIGNRAAGTANTIAFNGGAGIATNTGAGSNISILSNSIFSNALLGIDLGGDGVTANDANDADTGPNGLQNYPFLTSAIVSAGHTIVTGSLNTKLSVRVLVQLFQSAAPDSSGFGEGQTLITTLDLATNASGNLSFSFDLPSALPVGSFVSATAILPANEILNTGDTSEFSQAVQIVEAPSITVSNYSEVEQNGGTVEMFFSVHRTGDLSRASSFIYTTANGSATAPADYSHVPATLLTFAPGEAERTISVLVNGDTIDEPDETFFLNLSNPVNATIADAQAVGTIFDDDADLSPPAVLGSSFNFVGFLPTPYEVQFQMNEPVTASPGGVPVLIRRVDNGQLVATVMATIQGGSVVFGQMTTPLADGNYRATLPAGAVSDLAGNPLAVDTDVNFFVLAADANRDRTVDTRDLLILASNWFGTGKTFTEGDFNYDGTVNQADLTVMAQRWQVTLAPPPVVPSPPVPTIAGRRAPVRTPPRMIELVQ